MGGPWRRDYCRAGGGWYFLWVGEARLRAYLRERTVQLLTVALCGSRERLATRHSDYPCLPRCGWALRGSFWGEGLGPTWLLACT